MGSFRVLRSTFLNLELLPWRRENQRQRAQLLTNSETF